MTKKIEVPPKKLNPYTKRHKVESRLDDEEFSEAFTKAIMYFPKKDGSGDMSLLIRMALAAYRPIKKVSK